MKQVFLPLNIKRKDSSFGENIKQRGLNGRNAFISKGTKKEGIIFFSNRLAYALMWKDFKNVCERFINSEECEDKEKVKTFFNHLERKLGQAKDLKSKMA